MLWRNLFVIASILFFVIEPALASTTTGMPWEDPMDTVVDSITGPVAFGVSLLGVVAAGCALVWGGEMGEFVRKIIMLVLVIALIVAAASFLSLLFGGASAVVG